MAQPASITPPSKDVAVLLGNGLSIAFDAKLTIPNITHEIIARLDAAGDEDDPASALMQDVAERVRINNAGQNFEQLVAPFDEMVDVIKMVGRLRRLAGDRFPEAQKNLQGTVQFAEALRRHTVSHVLEVIAARSKAQHHRTGAVDRFIAAVVESAHGGDVTFGNLNYDALAMASLCNQFGHKLCDLTDGRQRPVGIDVVPDWPMEGRPLRTSADLPMSRKIALLHLHGSLTWLHNPATGQYIRVGIEDLRDSDYWAAWREGETEWEPVIVLTNQSSKNALVKQYPFSLGYKTFEQRLMTADRWLIAGASLGDDCLNEVLKRVWARRAVLPNVLVVTKGDWPSEKAILDALGYDPVWGGDPDPKHWLSITREGIERAPDSFEWMWWESTRPLARAPRASA